MSFDPSAPPFQTHTASQPRTITHIDRAFYYFAYGSCMCPVDLARTIEEDAHQFVVGRGILQNYRLAFNRLSPKRKSCGVLDVVPHAGSHVEGVLYHLPWRVSEKLDLREEVPTNGYRQTQVTVECQGQRFPSVRTYVVVNKTPQEVPPDDWYFYIVMRGAMTAGLSRDYSWRLFNHMKRLQRGQTL
ncbi:gamma-glutamylcyclotransferase family protein [Synechococcus sp. BDU 130192]|uniref:gamma-glutamylcyclotransferase family protein n=1 Tax=Synechococcus sp. BDU 130192 TaxID=2042059 RepID=UPI000C088C05|nr:gamma-glutamylcyclotransferase family protein [Synechococcus sp. BDU 130192]